MTKQKRKYRSYTDEFKLQMVQLIENGSKRQDIIKEFDLTSSSLDKWIKQYSNSKSFRQQDNLTDIEKELIATKKLLKQKDMELDILKQAALIMGQKSK